MEDNLHIHLLAPLHTGFLPQYANGTPHPLNFSLSLADVYFRIIMVNKPFMQEEDGS
jgi:hypothetical protein